MSIRAPSVSGRLLVVLAVVYCTSVTSAAVSAPAGALPNITGDCKDAPAPQMPQDGLSGWIDSGPVNPSTESIYTEYGRTPPWSTYDTGCGGSVRAPGATLDTTVANWVMGGATVTVAATAALHRLVSPPTFLNRLDPLVSRATAALTGGLYTPWLALSLLVLGVWLIWRAKARNLPAAVSAVGWAIIVMTGAAAAANYPVQAGHMADGVSVATVGQINAHMLGEPTGTGANPAGQAGAVVDPTSARASLLTDSLIYKQWLRGELGDPNSVVAKKYGPQLLAAQAYTYVEAAGVAKDPKFGAKTKLVGGTLVLGVLHVNQHSVPVLLSDQKQQAFKDIAAKIEKEDPSAYAHLKGESGSRIGPALIAFAGAILAAPFMIVADLLIIVALLILRLAVIGFPALAVVGLHSRLAHLVTAVLKMVCGALMNMIVFAAAAAVDALAVGILLGPDIGLPAWVALLLCGAITFILWQALKPFRKLTAMVTPTGEGRHVPGKLGRFLSSAAGTYTGAAVAWDRHDDDTAGGDAKAAAGGVVPVEGWSRPAAASDVPAAPARLVAVPPPSAVLSGTTWPPAALPLGASPLPSVAASAVSPAVPSPPVIAGTTTAAPPDGLPPVSVPVQAGHVEDSPSGQPAIEPGPLPEIFAAGERLPRPVFRADPVLDEDGRPVYRIWNAATQRYESVYMDEG